MKHALLTFAVLALAACGQTTAEAPEAPAPVDIAQSTGGACATVEALIDTLGMQPQGAIAGYTISAEGGVGVACSEPALDSVECALTGPAIIRVDGPNQSFANYNLDAGQSGTLTVGPNGPACHLNASAN